MTKNDIHWEILFDKMQILNRIKTDGFFEITAAEIKTQGKREARLMTKFDYYSQLPALFKENNLSVLPLTRGTYVIAPIKTFHKFEQKKIPVQRVEFPAFYESIDFRNITSESTALNCAFLTGILEHFLEDEKLMQTVSGRMRSSDFTFQINSLNDRPPLPVSVNNAQIEIDGGYEGMNYLSLIEAKNSISEDFLIRQIFYPFKLWSNKIRKPVKNIFLTYTNGIFHLREYVFADSENYNSLILTKESKYAIRNESITIALIQEIQKTTKIVKEPALPFPQADSFARVINLCELLAEKETLTKEEITLNYDFDIRQTDYYTNAGRYLGLIEKSKSEQIAYSLTDFGKAVMSLPVFERQKEFIKLILSHKVFNEALSVYFTKYITPAKFKIVEIMKRSNLYNINSEVTFRRRASTITGWINWILESAEE